MRILVADQNALLLAAITATFGPHCDLVTATRRDVCIAQVEQHKFDVVIACDKLSDHTGLELLSEVGAISPDTLLIFAAHPKRLSQLGKRLAVFGLFAVLSYPITPRKLLDILKRARQSLRTPSKPKVRHVVLDSEWDTGVRLGLMEKDLQAQAEAAGRREHDDWPAGAEAAATAPSNPGVEGDDFVFSAPPVVSSESESVAPPPRAESRARTFEATQVGSRAAPGANAQGTDASEVIEYEVKPVVLALTHDTGTIACDDEFIFASTQAASASVGGGTAELIEVEPAGAPAAQEPKPSIEDFCSNDPIFDVPEPPRWAEDGAANDTAYESRPTASAQSARATQRSESPVSQAYGQYGERGGEATGASGSQASDDTGSPAKPLEPQKAARTVTEAASSPKTPLSPKAPPQPRTRTRTQSVPTEAQRAAFERALARRKAASAPATTAPASGRARKGVKGGVKTEPTIQAGSMDSLFAGAPASDRPSKALSELARMAIRKRPLSVSSPNPNRSARPKRAVYAVSSGLAAVVILGVISFELLRSSRQAEDHMPHAQATSTQLFSSRTMMLDNNEGSGVPQFGPPIQQAETPQEAPPPNVPEPQTFDPNTAPEDPPPPPVVENPGPMEPPSEDVHTGPPLGMIQGTDGTTESE
jgi:CheY-like chemotaxis protein